MKPPLPVLLIFLLSCNYVQKDKPVSADIPINTQPNQSIDSTCTIIAVGDMMLGTNYPDKNRFTHNNILATLADTLKNADFTIGNLEGVLANNTLSSQKCKDKTYCYAFRSPPAFAHYFKEAGFDYLSIANNHSADFGNEGLKQTMQALQNAGIQYSGIKNTKEYAILENNQIKIGIIGVGHGARHIHINNYEQIVSRIKEVKEKVNLVVIFFHGGAEGDLEENVPKKQEIYLGEKRGNVHEMAHECVNAGADLVIGSGPHVTRALELYKNKLIAYSLGNFATYGKISVQGAKGLAPILKLVLSKNGNFVSGKIIPTMQKPMNHATPAYDSTGAVIKKLIRLSQQDFPNNNLQISPNGTLTYKNF
ncbi:MAG: CapA family protein [Niabella sp.]